MPKMRRVAASGLQWLPLPNILLTTGPLLRTMKRVLDGVKLRLQTHLRLENLLLKLKLAFLVHSLLAFRGHAWPSLERQ